MKNIFGRLAFIFAACLAPSLVSGQVTNTFAASANAYVYRGSASSDQDESQVLETKRLADSNTRMAYVRFDVGSFLTNFPIVNVTSARLRLYSLGGSADTLKVYGLNGINAS